MMVLVLTCLLLAPVDDVSPETVDAATARAAEGLAHFVAEAAKAETRRKQQGKIAGEESAPPTPIAEMTIPPNLVSPETQAVIDRTLRELASDDYHRREAAARNLTEIGTPALESLRAAAKSPDIELRFRAHELVKLLQSRVRREWMLLRDHQDVVCSVAYSTDSRRLASGGGGQHIGGKWQPGSDYVIRVWNLSRGKVEHTIPGHSKLVYQVTRSKDDKFLLSCSGDGTARIWRVSDATEVQQFRGHSEAVIRAVYSPDESQVATASHDKTVRVWDVASGKEIRQFAWPYGRIWGMALSPDGAFVAICGSHNSIRLHRVGTGELVGELVGHTNQVLCLNFSPDGRRLISGGWDKTARIWDVAEKKAIHILGHHAYSVEGVAWSADGRFVATGCLDQRVRVYDARIGELLRVFEGHEQSVAKLSFAPDGKSLASGSWDSTIRIWPTVLLNRVGK
jgi:WD40 repeat protein